MNTPNPQGAIDAAVTDFLTAGGGKSAKFDNVGDWVTGTIVAARKTQQTEFGTGAPKFYDDGNPMEQLVITLATDQRDPADPDDDGLRNVYLKGSKKDPQTGAGALIAALRAAGCTTIEVGGGYTQQLVGYGPATRGNPPKLWSIQYAAPPAVQVGDFLADAPQAAPAPQAPAPDAPQATPAAAPPVAPPAPPAPQAPAPAAPPAAPAPAAPPAPAPAPGGEATPFANL